MRKSQISVSSGLVTSNDLGGISHHSFAPVGWQRLADEWPVGLPHLPEQSHPYHAHWRRALRIAGVHGFEECSGCIGIGLAEDSLLSAV